MSCLHPITINMSKTGYRPQEVSCGRCAGCRRDLSRMWSERILHEMRYFSSSLFLTLTYDDDHLHVSDRTGLASLDKRDLQLFHKRLRFSLPDRQIKYFAVGEYGDATSRPHYHGVYLGIDGRDRNTIKDCWSLGSRFDFGYVSSASVKYVAGYISKKLSVHEKEEYDFLDVKPPFRLVSRGIGKRFVQDNQDAVVSGLHDAEGNNVAMPRQYLRWLDDQHVADYKAKVLDNKIAELERYYKITESQSHGERISKINKYNKSRLQRLEDEEKELNALRNMRLSHKL